MSDEGLNKPETFVENYKDKEIHKVDSRIGKVYTVPGSGKFFEVLSDVKWYIDHRMQ